MRENIGLGRPMWRGVVTATVLAVPLAGCGAEQAAGPGARAPARQEVASAGAERRATDATPAAPAIENKAAAAAAPAEASAPSGPERVLPTECEPGGAPCSAPARFVEQVCHGKYPDLALAMLSKGTPWRRGYVKVETLEPVNMYEGERNESWLSFGEEVLILRTRGSGGRSGVQVSGPTDVDILRWDGTCATIRQEMLAQYPTNTSVLTARVVWKYLDVPTQEALLRSPLVQYASDKERPACRGSTMKHPDAACDKASRKLTDAITVAVRGGITLPSPSKLPAWKE